MTTETLTVKKLARLSGVSVRALHHYDKIGLLTPNNRGENGYRLYSHNGLLRLQQILFYRELDIPLSRIKEVISDPKIPLRRLCSLIRKPSKAKCSDIILYCKPLRKH